MAKNLLIVKACNDLCSTEIEQIENIAKMFDMEPKTIEVKNKQDLKTQFCGGAKYDYLYLAAHADPNEFGSEDNSITITWSEFAEVICETQCLNQDSILLLGCCRGGLQRVADTLFNNCGQIDYVCGPRWTLFGKDITVGFHVFIYNMESRREQPSTAVKRASQATGYDFFCYDRVETEDRYQSAEFPGLSDDFLMDAHSDPGDRNTV